MQASREHAVPRAAPAMEALRANLIVGRARARLSQEQLAHRSGVSRPTISRIERGIADDVGIQTVQRLADALGLRLVDMLALTDHGSVDDGELARRAAASDDESVDADALFAAIDEAERPAALERYSRAGRPRVRRSVRP